jgi:hypothetical protein
MLVLAMEFSRCARHTSLSSARFETGKAGTCGGAAGLAPAPPRWTRLYLQAESSRSLKTE